MNNEQENLRELLSKFYSADETEQVQEDIVRGEQIIGDNHAPEPDAELIADIKTRVSDKLAEREHHWAGRYARIAMAVAAVVAIGFGLFLMHSHKPVGPGEVMAASGGIWESEDLTVDDASLAILVEDIEAIEDEVVALMLGENGTEGISIDELEIELLEISDDFWKG
jgi:hypothetical protein